MVKPRKGKDSSKKIQEKRSRAVPKEKDARKVEPSHVIHEIVGHRRMNTRIQFLIVWEEDRSTSWSFENQIDSTCTCRIGYWLASCGCAVSKYVQGGIKQYYLDEQNNRWTTHPNGKVVDTPLRLLGVRRVKGMRRTHSGEEYLLQWDHNATSSWRDCKNLDDEFRETIISSYLHDVNKEFVFHCESKCWVRKISGKKSVDDAVENKSDDDDDEQNHVETPQEHQFDEDQIQDSDGEVEEMMTHDGDESYENETCSSQDGNSLDRMSHSQDDPAPNSSNDQAQLCEGQNDNCADNEKESSEGGRDSPMFVVPLDLAPWLPLAQQVTQLLFILNRLCGNSDTPILPQPYLVHPEPLTAPSSSLIASQQQFPPQSNPPQIPDSPESPPPLIPSPSPPPQPNPPQPNPPIHAPVNPQYPCKICGKCYTSRSHEQRHRKLKHRFTNVQSSNAV